MFIYCFLIFRRSICLYKEGHFEASFLEFLKASLLIFALQKKFKKTESIFQFFRGLTPLKQKSG